MTQEETLSAAQDLVLLVLSGKLLEAFDKYYADDVTMQENLMPPTVGKAANRSREEAFLASVDTFHEAAAPMVTASEDRSMIHWIIDFTNKGGEHVRYDQVALQTWKDGKIVHERFIYNTGA